MTGATTEDARGYDHDDPHNDRKPPAETETDDTALAGDLDRDDDGFTPRHAATDDHPGEVTDRDETEGTDGVATGHAHVTDEDDPAGAPVTAAEAERAAATGPADDDDGLEPGTVYDHGTPVDDTAPDADPHPTGLPGTEFRDTEPHADDSRPDFDAGSGFGDVLRDPDGPVREDEPHAEPGPEPAAAPGTGSDEGSTAGVAGAPESTPEGVPVGPGVAAVDEDGKWWPAESTGAVMGRWREAQVAFVDDPAAAVREGRAAVEDAVRQLTESLAGRVDQLSGGGDGSDTERLRQVMRGYHRLLDRLVEL